MAKVYWTPAMDTALRGLRAEGFAWAEIARTLGLGSKTARIRARELDLPIGHLSSGTLSGMQVVRGKRPDPKRFTDDAKRLGKLWRAQN
jgi:hypothetical protein